MSTNGKVVVAISELVPPDEHAEPEGSESWADRLWGPRDPDALDLRPELLSRPKARQSADPADSADPAAPSSPTLSNELIDDLKRHVRATVAATEVELKRYIDTAMGNIESDVHAAVEAMLAPIASQLAAQADAFEGALNALAKAVSDERRSTAAYVRGALANTDATVRVLGERLEFLIARGLPAQAPQDDEDGHDRPSSRFRRGRTAE